MQQVALTSAFIRMHRASPQCALRRTHCAHLLRGVLAKSDVAALGTRSRGTCWSAGGRAHRLLMVLGRLDDKIGLSMRGDVNHEISLGATV